MNSFQDYIKDMPVVPLIEHVSSADPRGILVNDREYLEIYQVSQPCKCKKKKKLTSIPVKAQISLVSVSPSK